MTKPPTFNGIPMTETKLAALTRLAKCPTGSTHVEGVMNGGTLAALVQMGLAGRVQSHRLGAARFMITDAGRAVLVPEEPEEEAV